MPKKTGTCELQDLIENYLSTERKPLRQDIASTHKFKPKILKRGPIIERVTSRIYDFVETFFNGMTG